MYRVLRNIWFQSVFEPFLLVLFRSESRFTIRLTVPELLANYMFLIQLSNYSLLPYAFPSPPISKRTPPFNSPGHSKQVTTQHFVNWWPRSWDMTQSSFKLFYIVILFAISQHLLLDSFMPCVAMAVNPSICFTVECLNQY